jgi:Zn-dependent peptidase ImmA (M78 family)
MPNDRSSRKLLARQAARMAIRTRRAGCIPSSEPVCVYDLAEAMKIEVKFCPETSLEGMAVQGLPPVILVSSQRPAGRQTYNCAHELGHILFGHGTKVDEYLDEAPVPHYDDPEEFMADLFAAYLLMPPDAVDASFAKRSWSPSSCNPRQAYTVAGELGVGYETLVQHMRWSLAMIQPEHAQMLLKASPKKIRAAVLGEYMDDPLIIVDSTWRTRAVDLYVGDHVLLPVGTEIDGDMLAGVRADESGVLARGTTQGKGRVRSSAGDWAVFIRVSKKQYAGRSIFRHLEDPDDHQQS